jgi:hypothetical protein
VAPSGGDGGAPALPTADASSRNPQDAWEDWLSQNGVHNGINQSADGSDFRYYAFSQAVVAEGPPDQFVNRRNIAFQKAMMTVKGELAGFVATDIQGGQLLKAMTSNGAAPPALMEAAKSLSIMEKARTLTDKALDDQIKRYDPSFDGTGVSPEQRQKRLLKLEEGFQANLASQARLFVGGAMPAAVFEGMGPDGNYMVGVGAIWSPRLAQRAHAIIDPNTQVDRTPNTVSIRDQIKAKLAVDPQFLAAANGLAIWRNELGEPTVLAFVGIDAIASQMLVDASTRLQATGLIQKFVGEQVVTESALNQQLTERVFDDQKREAFDQSGLQSQINTTAPKMTISGLAPAYSWEGINPVSKSRMVVRVFAWTPSSRAAVTKLQEASDIQKRAVQSGGLNVAPATGRSLAAGQQSVGGAGGMQAAPLRNGQATNASEF